MDSGNKPSAGECGDGDLRGATLRVHFNRLWPQIRRDMESGHTVAWVYRKLRASGEWPGSYGSLRHYVSTVLDTDESPRYRGRRRPGAGGSKPSSAMASAGRQAPGARSAPAKAGVPAGRSGDASRPFASGNPLLERRERPAPKFTPSERARDLY